MLKSLVIGMLVSVIAGVAAHAQAVIPPGVAMSAMADMQKLQAAMVAAQAAAIKPGDEGLPCDALQKELISTMTDPKIQAYAAKTNEAYAKELAAQQKNGAMTAESAAALAAALTANMSMGGMPQITPGQAASLQQMQQAMIAQQQLAVNYMNQLMPLMPALMRSQRVTQLALVKNCAWMTSGLGFGPGVTPEAFPGPAPRR